MIAPRPTFSLTPSVPSFGFHCPLDFIHQQLCRPHSECTLPPAVSALSTNPKFDANISSQLLPFLNLSELERQANIARNKALLQELELTDAVNNIGFSKKPPPPPPKAQTKAKPVQPAKRTKREAVEDPGPRRQSARLKRSADDPNESPEEKRARLVRTPLNSVVILPCLAFRATLVASRRGAETEGRRRTSPSRGT